MPGSAIVSGNGVVLIEIPAGGNTGEVLTKLSNDDFDFDWAPGGGGGGQVDSVVGGTNINVNAADPVNPIVNLDAAIAGVSVNGVTLTTAGAATNFLNEQGNYVAVSLSPTRQDTYDNAPAVPQLTVNGTPDPVTIDASVAGDVFAVRNVADLDILRAATTGITLGQDTSARTNQTLDIGEQAATGLFDRIQGRLGFFLGSSNTGGARVAAPVATQTLDAAAVGVVAGNSVNATGGGTPILRHGNTAITFKPLATIVNLWAAYGDAIAENNSGGGFLGGSTYTYGAGSATLQAGQFGNFTWAYSYTSGAGNHLWQNNGPGAFMMGYSQGAGVVNVVNTTQAAGAFTQGRPTAGAGTAELRNAGAGAFIQGRVSNGNAATLTDISTSGAGDGGFAQGYASSSGANAGRIRVEAAGGFAQGRSVGGTIQVSAGAEGGFAHGYAGPTRSILATADGAFAAGEADSGDITASGAGAFAFGQATADIVASAANAVQFGPGTNSTARSLQVGDGVRLVGDSTTLGAGQVALLVFDNDNATLEQVTVGAADSGGVGFKLLRIPN